MRKLKFKTVWPRLRDGFAVFGALGGLSGIISFFSWIDDDPNPGVQIYSPVYSMLQTFHDSIPGGKEESPFLVIPLVISNDGTDLIPIEYRATFIANGKRYKGKPEPLPPREVIRFPNGEGSSMNFYDTGNHDALRNQRSITRAQPFAGFLTVFIPHAVYSHTQTNDAVELELVVIDVSGTEYSSMHDLKKNTSGVIPPLTGVFIERDFSNSDSFSLD